MKSKIVSFIIAVAMAGTVISGCGKESEQTQPTGSSAETTATETEVSIEATSENTETKETSSNEDLYEEFKDGTSKATFTKDGDRGSYLTLSTILEDGKEYSLSEITENIENNAEYSLKVSGDASYRLIDCGNDGNKELLVQQEYVSEEMGSEIFTLFMIIKDTGEELKICYDQDMWSRSEVTINDDGTILGSGSGGAALHVYDYAYVDANGDYHFCYGQEENYTPTDIYYMQGGDYIEVSLEGLDQEHLVVNSYYFEADADKRSDYISFDIIDDQYNIVTTDEDYAESNDIVKRFAESGIKVYTSKEIEDLLSQRAGEIGYPVESN